MNSSIFQDELVEQLKEQGVEITDTPIYVKCHRDYFVKESSWEGMFEEGEEPKDEDDWLEFARDTAEDYSPEDLIEDIEHELGDLNDCSVVEEEEISEPDWCYLQEYIDEEVITTVEFYVKCWSDNGQYCFEVVTE